MERFRRNTPHQKASPAQGEVPSEGEAEGSSVGSRCLHTTPQSRLVPAVTAPLTQGSRLGARSTGLSDFFRNPPRNDNTAAGNRPPRIYH